jgi:hypothetical protein
MNMKYIITENQYKNFKENQLKTIEKLKPSLIKYWNKNGPSNTFNIIKFFGIDKPFYDVVNKWLIEWYGGPEVVEKKISELILNKEFRGVGGSYDFKYKVNDFNVSDEMITCDIIVDGNGEIFVEREGREPITNIYDADKDPDFGWQIIGEISDVINKTNTMYREIKDKLGFEIYIDDISILNKDNKEFN